MPIRQIAKEKRPSLFVFCEDSAGHRLIINEALEQVCGDCDVLVTPASSGKEVESLLREYHDDNIFPSVIMLDNNMGDMLAEHLVPTLRKFLPPIPIVVLTMGGMEEEQLVTKMYRLGINAFLIKPETIDDYVEVLNAVHKFYIEGPQPEWSIRGISDKVDVKCPISLVKLRKKVEEVGFGKRFSDVRKGDRGT